MMIEHFYSIYSPSKNAWLNEDGGYGPCAAAAKFKYPDKLERLEGDQRWVGPLAEGDYK